LAYVGVALASSRVNRLGISNRPSRTGMANSPVSRVSRALETRTDGSLLRPETNADSGYLE
jgi:hypothetical protein